MVMPGSRMVEDGVIKIGGAELERTILMLLPSAHAGSGENTLANVFFGL